ncbi:MAG: TolC family protein [Armatimonadetes bacterium]|nr:TolC family protein [Armatimonadota bacterium]
MEEQRLMITHPSRRKILLLAALCLSAAPSAARETPPESYRSRESPLPPPIEIPAPASRPADLPDRPLTAGEAVEIALRHHANVAAARAGVAGAEARLRQAEAPLKITVGTSAGHTHAERVITEGGSGGGLGTSIGGSTVSASGSQASATIRRLLFDSRHTRDLVRQAEATERGAAENVTRAEYDLALLVKLAYYTYLQNTRLVAVQESNLRNRQEQSGQAEARLKEGVGIPLDVVRGKTAIADATLNLTVARNNAANARVSLALLMGIDPRTPIAVGEGGEPEIAADDLDKLVETALGQRPEVSQARRSVEAAQHGLNAAKSTNAPNVSATLGLSSRSADFPPVSTTASLGAVVTWTPFDGGVAQARRAEAQASIEATEAQLTNARQAVVAGVTQAYLNLHTAEQRVTTAEAGIANAEESLRLARGRYDAGFGTFLDVLDAQASLVTARTSHVNAQAAVAQARASLAHALGMPVR